VTFDGEVECQTEMATYVLFRVHTDDTDTDTDTDDTLIFYSIDKQMTEIRIHAKKSAGRFYDQKATSVQQSKCGMTGYMRTYS
jgi:hypothetical protein